MRSLNSKGLTWRSMPVLLAGLLAGAVLVQPAVAHVKKSLGHLTKHLDPRYYNLGEKVGDADTLDGVDSAGFARTGAAYTKSESDARYAPTVHNHDDRYFTETESDARYYNVGEQAGDADTVDGYHANGLVRVGGAVTSTGAAMPACTSPLDYTGVTFTAPQAGFALANASFTGNHASGATAQMRAWIDRTAPTLVGGTTQDERAPAGDEGNIALTQVFPVAAGVNTFTLRVCDFSAVDGANTDTAQLTILYSGFNLAGSPTRVATEVQG